MPETKTYHFSGPDELHLWLLPITEVPAKYFPQYYRLLSPGELERNRRYVFEKDRIRDLLTRAFIRKLLANYLSVAPEGLQFEANTHGRPTLLWPDGKPGLDFNLSHAGEMIACGIVSTGRIGIDIEPTDREVNISHASHFFSKIELDELARLPVGRQKDHFLRLWTLKESYIKACGRGLSIALDSFGFYDFGEGKMRFWSQGSVEEASGPWSFFLLQPIWGYRMAGAWQHANAPRPEVNIRLRKFLPVDPHRYENLPFSIEDRVGI